MSADNNTVAATLLLADASPTIQRVIELTFADEDVRVVVVGDGDAAIARIEEQPPDIVLADVGMPGKNGYEVASYVKHALHLSHIPVLLLTGAFESIDERKANEAGSDGVISKPFEPQLVIGRVKELLERSRGRISAPGLVGSVPLSVPTPERAVLPTPAHADGPSAGSESLGDFFDKLDAAFANLPVARREMSTPEDAGEPAGGARGGAVPPAATNEDTDGIWDTELPPTSGSELPSFLAPSHDVGRRPSQRPQFRPATGPLATVPSRASDKQAMPPLAEAFAALLTAEQPGAAPANTATWAPPPRVTDDLVERVAQRVLERLSDRVVRETTTELVSSIAERLVREEIDRIKAAIKNL